MYWVPSKIRLSVFFLTSVKLRLRGVILTEPENGLLSLTHPVKLFWPFGRTFDQSHRGIEMDRLPLTVVGCLLLTVCATCAFCVPDHANSNQKNQQNNAPQRPTNNNLSPSQQGGANAPGSRHRNWTNAKSLKLLKLMLRHVPYGGEKFELVGFLYLQNLTSMGSKTLRRQRKEARIQCAHWTPGRTYHHRCRAYSARHICFSSPDLLWWNIVKPW
jgi:hypothetical protein